MVPWGVTKTSVGSVGVGVLGSTVSVPSVRLSTTSWEFEKTRPWTARSPPTAKTLEPTPVSGYVVPARQVANLIADPATISHATTTLFEPRYAAVRLVNLGSNTLPRLRFGRTSVVTPVSRSARKKSERTP